MSFHDKKVSLSGTHGSEVFYFFYAEYFEVLSGGSFLAFHHFLEVDTNLNASVGTVTAGLCSLHLCHHLAFVTLCDGCDLNAHIGFVDRTYVMKFTSKLLDNEMHIVCKVRRGCLCFPSAFAHEPFWAGKMVKGDKRFHSIFFTACNDITVVLHFIQVKRTFFRFDPCPFNGKAIGI